jgi:uncharacterized membrane protein
MSTGELMDRTLVLYKKNFKLFVGIASLGPATYLLFQLLTIGSASVQARNPNDVNPFSAASLGFGFLAGFLIMLAGMAIAQGATVRAVAAVHLGLPIRIMEAYRSLRGRLWRIFGVFVCMGLLAFLAVLVAVLLIFVLMLMLRTLSIVDPGREGRIFAVLIGFGTILIIAVSAMVVWVRYALAIACCVVEDLGVMKSIKRSSKLSKGSRFRIFLIYIVFMLLAVTLGVALGAIAGGVGALIPNMTVRIIVVYFAGFIASLLTGPLATIGVALVYYDERIRKEAFDLQLMMSSLDAAAPVATAAVAVQS